MALTSLSPISLDFTFVVIAVSSMSSPVLFLVGEPAHAARADATSATPSARNSLEVVCMVSSFRSGEKAPRGSESAGGNSYAIGGGGGGARREGGGRASWRP